MPTVTCLSCGERGKIAPNLIGARIKCRKCGISFQVSPPVAKAVAAAGAAGAAPAAAVDTHGGIEVEGLEESSWSLPTVLAPGDKAEVGQESGHGAESSAFAHAGASPSGLREYKILTPRDKYFGGVFELARLEEALNHYARQGWVAKGISTPHVKGFSGALEETLVVLLERGHEGA